MNDKTKRKKKNKIKLSITKMRNHFYEHGVIYGVVIFAITILSIPFILYALAINNDFFAKLVSGDTLSYYGVAFGIFSSFIVLLIQKKKDEEQRLREVRPKIVLKVEIVSGQDKAYIFSIKNIGLNTLKNVCFDGDDFVECLLPNESQSLNLDCNEDDIVWYEFDNDYPNFYRDSNGKGIPLYLTIQCTDNDDKMWCIEFKGYSSSRGVSYYQEDMYII